MKYCVSARQMPAALKMADEVRVFQKDLKGIPELANKYPHLDFIYEVSNNEDIDWNCLSNYIKAYNITLALKNISLLDFCRKEGYKCFWDYPIASYADFYMICQNQDIISEIILDSPLFFNLSYVKKHFKGTVRVFPNLAAENYLFENKFQSLLGTYIRPEDIKVYEQYVGVCEFITDSLTKEETLLKVYKEDQQWLGNLNLLLTNLNYNVDNRAIPEEFGEIRTNCKQKCLEGTPCHFCEDAILFADAIREESKRRKKEKAQMNNL